MQLTFFGVRGSIPSPGPEYVRYGGNTACAHIVLNDGTDIILDAGTGIKNLGHELLKKHTDIHLLLSHNHWDHIQGFPFFLPIYQQGRKIIITPGVTDADEPDAVLKQMSGSVFPVDYKTLQSDVKVNIVPQGTDSWTLNSAKVSRFAMNHPGGGSAYLIEADGASIAYITDNELYPPYEKATDFQEWVTFAQNVDLLIHDAQYVKQDMPRKLGWGHSVAEETIKLAMACNAKQLALYSHDHNRTDEEIDEIVAHCEEYADIVGATVDVFGAREGQTITF
ncbi:MBL fold metallo-hydrolase [Aestuariibacter salexigens]|uniref:MBL fold metallo-hydrolase n=1 Tax=Aestuariibacter salexigens TaxID=226010 RepID=UPI000428FA47|nr:MBL fold metallo-hydrolase [Aestuariibacter salexigens]